MVKDILYSLVFVLVGAVVGYLYYKFVGCKTGTCPIASNPIKSMIYVGLIGLFLSFVFKK